MPIPRLETTRLLLREWTAADEVPFAEMNADPEVMEFFPQQLTKEESARFIARANQLLLEKEFGYWAVEVKDTHEFIGFIGLSVPQFEAPFMPCLEIGWRLKKQVWGKGYATEGAIRALEYAFYQMGMKEVFSFTSIFNVRSMQLMKRIGMVRCFGEDFDHPKVEKGHRLERHALYRIAKLQC